MKKIKIYIFILLTVSLFSSCRIGKKFQIPEIDYPENFGYETTFEGIASDISWKTFYQDSILQTLIDKALANNKDILIAAAKVREIAAAKRIQSVALLPEIGLNVAADREYESYRGNNQSYSDGFEAKAVFSWELDLWGNLRWKNEAAVASYLQTLEAQEALRLSIISEVAQVYFELVALYKELDIVKKTLNARQESVKLSKLRYDGGLTSEIPHRQSLVELARTETLIPTLERRVKTKENDLAFLVGDFSLDLDAENDFKLIPMLDDLPVDLPSFLLQRRPDVRQAELELKEANAKVGVALTNIFPRIRLTGALGAESGELANFLQNPAWLVAGAITGPIFNFGRNNAGHKAAKAVYEQEVYRYERKILNVFQEVNNAIISFEKTKIMYKSALALYESTKTYHDLAQLQYINGYVAYIELLDAQRQLFDAEINLNNTVLNELIAAISLYKALGGGVK
jgi:multidrug efflux system outer membrane protein